MPETRTVAYDGDEIRRLRKEADLTLVQLGERTGRHPMALQAIESKRKNASLAMITGIAHALGVSVADITVTDEPAPHADSRRVS